MSCDTGHDAYAIEQVNQRINHTKEARMYIPAAHTDRQMALFGFVAAAPFVILLLQAVFQSW